MTFPSRSWDKRSVGGIDWKFNPVDGSWRSKVGTLRSGKGTKDRFGVNKSQSSRRGEVHE